MLVYVYCDLHEYMIQYVREYPFTRTVTVVTSEPVMISISFHAENDEYDRASDLFASNCRALRLAQNYYYNWSLLRLNYYWPNDENNNNNSNTFT